MFGRPLRTCWLTLEGIPHAWHHALHPPGRGQHLEVVAKVGGELGKLLAQQRCLLVLGRQQALLQDSARLPCH